MSEEKEKKQKDQNDESSYEIIDTSKEKIEKDNE